MRILPYALAAWVAGAALAPASAQLTLLDEQFTSSQTGVFPPANWRTESLNSTPSAWNEAALAFTGTTLAALGSDAAGHEYSAATTVQCESLLIAPSVDLSAMVGASVSFRTEFAWIYYMAHLPVPLGNGASTLRVSTDNGQTWAQLWRAYPASALPLWTETVDLAPLLGAPDVQLAWHYSGAYAHSWAVDDVRVLGQPVGGAPTLALGGGCPGTTTLSGSGMTPGGLVILYFAYTGGGWTVPFGSCLGTVLPVAQPYALPAARAVQADAVGGFTLTGTTSAFQCGALLGAVDVASCTATATVVL